MKRIAVLSFKDNVNVSKGLSELFEIHPDAVALIPVIVMVLYLTLIRKSGALENL